MSTFYTGLVIGVILGIAIVPIALLAFRHIAYGIAASLEGSSSEC